MRSAVQSSASRRLRPRVRATRSTNPPPVPASWSNHMPALAPVMTTARLPLRPQRHSWPPREAGLAQKLGRDLGSPGAKLGIEGLPVAPAHRVPRGTDTPTRDDPRAAADGREGWRERADKAAGGPGSRVAFPRFCRLSDMPRDVGAGPPAKPTHGQKGWTPPGKTLKSSRILGGAQQPQSAAPPMGVRAAQSVGSTRRRANQLNGSTVATPSSLGVSPTRRRAVVRECRASFPAETVHGRSPKVRSKNGRPFRACRRCGSIPARSLRWPRSRLERGPTLPGLGYRPALFAARAQRRADGVTRPCADPVRFAAAPRRVARRAAGSASPWRRRGSPTPVPRRLVASGTTRRGCPSSPAAPRTG